MFYIVILKRNTCLPLREKKKLKKKDVMYYAFEP